MFKTAAHVPGDLNRLARETGMLLATVDSLTDDEFAVPSRCDGWTRAHVIAHLALNADAFGNMITWGTTGVETPPYVSRDARNADIENLAKESPAQIKAALHTAVKNFADKAATLQSGLKAETVKTPGGADISPYAVPAMRISEVIIHHADLDTVCGGRGICGRCQVAPANGSFAKWAITVESDALGAPGSLETDYHGNRPMLPGHRLGCAARIEGDVVVDVPPSSQRRNPCQRA